MISATYPTQKDLDLYLEPKRGRGNMLILDPPGLETLEGLHEMAGFARVHAVSPRSVGPGFARGQS